MLHDVTRCWYLQVLQSLDPSRVSDSSSVVKLQHFGQCLLENHFKSNISPISSRIFRFTIQYTVDDRAGCDQTTDAEIALD